MSDLEPRIAELRREAAGLPAGPTKIALLEEAARLADLVGDVRLGYRVRDALMEAAAFAGRGDLLLVAFAWCLARFDAEPDHFFRHGLYWKYKWVVGHAVEFPEIPRAKIDELLDDMQRRWEQDGNSLHAVWTCRRMVAVHLRDEQAARAAHAELRRTRRDWLSDCEACVVGKTMGYHLFAGDRRRALQVAEPLLAGRLTCQEQPRAARGSALLPLIRKGDWDEARRLHDLAWRIVRGLEHAVDEHAEHLVFVTLAGDFAKARRMLERHLPAALEVVSLDNRFDFLVAARLLVARLRESGSAALKLRLPTACPAPDERGRVDLAALEDWLEAEARAIAVRFDRRNGNDGFVREVDAFPELLALAAPRST